MRKHIVLLSLLCCTLFTAAHAADKHPKAKANDYSCNYYSSRTGLYYCVETSAACTVSHAYIKPANSTASPTLVVLALKSSINGCLTFEGSLDIGNGDLIVVNVQTCDCGNHITTHVFFARDL